MEDNKVYINGIEYDLDNFKPKASLQDIIIATISNEQDEAECEADFGFYYLIYWENNNIYIDFCQENESIESYLGNTDHIEREIYSRHLFVIKDVKAIDFINIIIDYDLYKKEYIFNFGHNRVYGLHFCINKETEKEIAKMGNKKLIDTFLRTLIKYRRC